MLSSHFFLKTIHNIRMNPINAKKVVNDEVMAYSPYMARENAQTCTAQGFIYILSLRAWSSYYAALMILCKLQLNISFTIIFLFHDAHSAIYDAACAIWNRLAYRPLWMETMSIERTKAAIALRPNTDHHRLGLAIPPLFLGMYSFPGRLSIRLHQV
jgi:hypothetical protein